ncbi:MAG: 5'/3'-nucleotidase SurE [Candidatus Heimdallarchaeota archaeon]|nr:5'/3'-nucleotidase SurE [Candidatus Heimdallarchaeota archaeon]
MNILVSNDDGINSVGIDVIAKYAKEWGDSTIICPQSQQTASGKGLTFHKPIRVVEAQTVSGIPAMTFNTVPADSVIIFQHLKGKPDVVLSGLNAGENTSIHSILTSGTCAVAMEAGMKNIPSFAFSIDTPEMYFHSNQIPGNIDLAGKLSIKIAKKFIELVDDQFWEEVIFVNINFPDDLNEETEIVLVEPETYKYNNSLYEREDPKGDKYYWLWGSRRSDFTPGADASVVHDEKKIAVTPISFKHQEALFTKSQHVLDNL